MPRDDLYLVEIVEACRHVAAFVAGKDSAEFVRDELVKSAVLQKLVLIGEAAGAVDEAIRRRHPSVPWNEARGLRNRAVHAYFEVDWSLVWEVATERLPLLQGDILRVLDQEFPALARRLRGDL